MPVLEEKKIVIRLPHFHWRLFLNPRFALVCALLLLAGFGTYWYQAIRPYLWISGAHVEAFSTIVNSDMVGRIVEMGPQEGDRVKKGETLFVLDRDQMLAKQAEMRRSFDSLSGQIEKEKEQIGKAMEDYLAATSELDVGIGSYDQVKKQLSLMEEAQQKAETATSQLASVRAALSDLDIQAKKMTFAAPFDGMVLKKAKSLGAAVSFGEPIYILCDPDRLWIQAEIPESELSRVTLGTPIRAQLPAYPKTELHGTVSWIGPATVAKSALLPLSEQKETIPIKISFEKPPFSLKPGLSASVGLKVR